MLNANKPIELKNRTERDIRHEMDLLIALHLIGRNKLSAYKVTSDSMIEFYKRVLELGGHPYSDQKICSSRKTMMQTVRQYANVIREDLKVELKNVKCCVIHDDGTTKHGMNESLRAISVTFVKNGRFQRRFLHIEKITSKTGKSIADTIAKVMEHYGVTDYYIASDGASANHVAARLLGLQNDTCMTHTVNRISESSWDLGEKKITGFKEFMTIVKKLLNKASRKHINAKFCDLENFVKIPSLCDTRWLSLFNCINALLKNHEIILANRSIFGLSQNEFEIFEKKELLIDLRDLLQHSKTALLKLEVQKRPTLYQVLPIFHNFQVHCIKMTCDIERTNIGRQLAFIMKNKINTYIFGDENISPRLTTHHIIQTGLNIQSNLFNKFNKPLQLQYDGLSFSGSVSKTDLQDEISSNLRSFRSSLYPSLKEIFKKIDRQPVNNNLNSESSESDQELDLESYTDLSESTKSSISLELTQKKLKRQESKIFKNLKHEYEKFKVFMAVFHSGNYDDDRFKVIIEKYNLLQENKHLSFWSLPDVKLCFPILQKIVMDSIVIPASNAMVESLFSHVSDIKNFRRSKLSEKSLNDLLTLFYADLYMDNSATNYFKSEL